jgi:cytoskeletal protein CcmA (bactofilin family)
MATPPEGDRKMFNKKPNSDRDFPGMPSMTPPSYMPEPTALNTPTNTTPATNTNTDTLATATSAAAGGAGTFLADGTTFQGKANIAGTMRIEGKADGELEATDSIVVGRTGLVQANLKTRRAVLNGRFQGKILAADRVEMQAGSRVEADVHAKNMVMEDGVQFTGNCKIGQ